MPSLSLRRDRTYSVFSIFAIGVCSIELPQLGATRMPLRDGSRCGYGRDGWKCRRIENGWQSESSLSHLTSFLEAFYLGIFPLILLRALLDNLVFL